MEVTSLFSDCHASFVVKWSDHIFWKKRWIPTRTLRASSWCLRRQWSSQWSTTRPGTWTQGRPLRTRPCLAMRVASPRKWGRMRTTTKRTTRCTTSTTRATTSSWTPSSSGARSKARPTRMALSTWVSVRNCIECGWTVVLLLGFDYCSYLVRTAPVVKSCLNSFLRAKIWRLSFTATTWEKDVGLEPFLAKCQ